MPLMPLLSLGLDPTAENYVAVLAILGIAFMAFLGALYFAYVKLLRKGFRIPDMPAGSIVLVEGPVDSKKSRASHAFLVEKALKGEKVAVISFHKGVHEKFFQEKKLGGSGLVKVVEADNELTDLGMTFSSLISWGAKIIYAPILSEAIIKSKFDEVAKFVSFNTKKSKNAGVTVVFGVDTDSVPKTNVAALEVMMDGVIEFKSDAGDFVRMKKNVLGEASDWEPV